MSKFLYVLNGQKMTDPKSTHHYLQQRFNFPDYYGHNLDALFDLLSTYNDEEVLNIVLINANYLLTHQPEYGQKLIETLLDAQNANYKIKVFVSQVELL